MLHSDDVVVGRVLSEDSAFMTIEIAKSSDEQITLRQGDRFYTFMFVEIVGPEQELNSFRPWLKESHDG